MNLTNNVTLAQLCQCTYNPNQSPPEGFKLQRTISSSYAFHLLTSRDAHLMWSSIQSNLPVANLWLNNGTYYLSFRGTVNYKNWFTDLSFETKEYQGLKVHEGFLELYLALKDQITQTLGIIPDRYPLILTGHSLGAALAQLCCLDLAYQQCVTFACPKMGVQIEMVGRPSINNIINSLDIVPLIPPFFTRLGNDTILTPQVPTFNEFTNHSLETYLSLARSLEQIH